MPRWWRRISVAVNNYFSTLEAAQAAEAAAAEVAAAEAAKALEAEAESSRKLRRKAKTVAEVPATAVADAEPPAGAEVATEGEAEAVRPTEEEEKKSPATSKAGQEVSPAPELLGPTGNNAADEQAGRCTEAVPRYGAAAMPRSNGTVRQEGNERRMKIRINDLARELEVKSKQILDVLIKVGVTEKKTHSSSVEEDEAEKVRKYFHEMGGTSGARAPGAKSSARRLIYRRSASLATR